MPIKSNFDKNKLERFLNEYTFQVFEQRVLERLYYLGEMCVNEARTMGSYTDRTGNLRSSVGYGVFKDGVELGVGGFEQVNNANEGMGEGRSLLRKIAGEQPKGSYSLVVVAGMNYGVYVEARGYNVLSSSELLAERELPRLMNDIFDT